MPAQHSAKPDVPPPRAWDQHDAKISITWASLFLSTLYHYSFTIQVGLAKYRLPKRSFKQDATALFAATTFRFKGRRIRPFHSRLPKRGKCDFEQYSGRSSHFIWYMYIADSSVGLKLPHCGLLCEPKFCLLLLEVAPTRNACVCHHCHESRPQLRPLRFLLPCFSFLSPSERHAIGCQMLLMTIPNRPCKLSHHFAAAHLFWPSKTFEYLLTLHWLSGVKLAGARRPAFIL